MQPETEKNLELYLELLKKWQRSINLVSPQTMDKAWDRHFLDSMQLFDYVPRETKTWVDFGSGAGFPGLVMAIMCPSIDVHLVESDQKKCSFLKAVSRETKCRITTHNHRIESLELPFKPDIISARALASLETLCEYSLPYCHDDTILFFMKGETLDDEIDKAQSLYSFHSTIHQSSTSASGKILELHSLKTR